ncbi:MAG: RNA pseudouridine synthase, partial [Bdellovibrionaceae bacterium]|nr:RNA pseudouridine synthase [Pseudobdellovibrionaceae bacterium]
KKIYNGILRGKLSANEGVWDQPLTDKAEGRTNPQGIPKSRVACETRYKTVTANTYFTHCEFQLITGRQHQIRKHTALVKHALVGDPRYNDPKYNKKIAEIYKHTRMLLHCSSVDILEHSFKCDLPKEFADLLPPTE